MKTLFQALRMIAVLTLITGVSYPLLVLGFAKTFLSHEANGSLIYSRGTLVGSELIAQSFSSPRYFWPRPSAVGHNPLPSSGTNYGATSKSLQGQIAERRIKLLEANGGVEPPDELLLASGSGLDPHISPASVQYQVNRVAAARNLDADQLNILRNIVSEATEPRMLGFLGQPRVNVLKLNLAIDSAFGHD